MQKCWNYLYFRYILTTISIRKEIYTPLFFYSVLNILLNLHILGDIDRNEIKIWLLVLLYLPESLSNSCIYNPGRFLATSASLYSKLKMLYGNSSDVCFGRYEFLVTRGSKCLMTLIVGEANTFRGYRFTS